MAQFSLPLGEVSHRGGRTEPHVQFIVKLIKTFLFPSTMNSYNEMENYVSSHLPNMGNTYKYCMKVYNEFVEVTLPTAQIRPMTGSYMHDISRLNSFLVRSLSAFSDQQHWPVAIAFFCLFTLKWHRTLIKIKYAYLKQFEKLNSD